MRQMGKLCMPIKLGILSDKDDHSLLEKLIVFNISCFLERYNISSNHIDYFALNKLIGLNMSLLVFQLLVPTWPVNLSMTDYCHEFQLMICAQLKRSLNNINFENQIKNVPADICMPLGFNDVS